MAWPSSRPAPISSIIGGESTKPGALPVPDHEERRRVLPVIRELAAQTRVPLSIDTMKPGVAEAAIEAGASIINDVAANRSDPALWHVAAQSGAGYVAMHMQGTPKPCRTTPAYRRCHRGRACVSSSHCSTSLGRAGVATRAGGPRRGDRVRKGLEHNLELLGQHARL
jgi:dihydropteroate synthase